MRRLLWLPLVVVFCLETVQGYVAVAEDSTQLQSIQVTKTLTGSRITLQATSPISVVLYTLQNPDRLIVDPVEQSLTSTVSPSQSFLGGGIVKNLRIITEGGAIDYLVFSTSGPVVTTLDQADQLITIEVQLASGAGPPPMTPMTPLRSLTPANLPPPLPPVDSAVSPEAPETFSDAGAVDELPAPPATWMPRDLDVIEGGELLPAGPLAVSEAIEQAMAVYEPARIALEETELANLKVKEARRNLFPGASLRGTYTSGTASDVGFRETQAGLQLEHPLFDGHRLRDAYKQSLVNLQVSQKRYEKVRADFAFDVAQAYFELMAAHQAVILRQQLLEEAQRTLDTTQQRFTAGLVTKLESLNVQSQFSQAQFQVEGARNDEAVAELKFRHRMNWESPEPLAVPEYFPPSDQPAIDLEEALQVAAANRPDLQLNTLLVEFHRYEEKLAQEKEAWKLDLTGFLGASGGAFESESLSVDKDYSIALKASRPWGGNSTAITATTVETSPRVGQTTRTSSNSLQSEIGFLNALAGKSEIKQANIGLLKAAQDLAETRHVLEQEVHEAYFAYQKALMTLQHAQQKEQFRQEQVKILKAQGELNEAAPSQILEALLQLSDDQVSQVQAQAGYHVALARLNKAIGVTAYYQ